MNIVGRLIGLLVLCLVVGLFLSMIGVTAQSIFVDTWGTLVSLARVLQDFLLWAVPYTVLGAVIVVPLAALSAIRRFSRRR